jgi:hypothetical protein
VNGSRKMHDGQFSKYTKSTIPTEIYPKIMKKKSMQLHQDSFKIQPETGRNGDKIYAHNTQMHDHSFYYGLVQTLQ